MLKGKKEANGYIDQISIRNSSAEREANQLLMKGCKWKRKKCSGRLLTNPMDPELRNRKHQRQRKRKEYEMTVQFPEFIGKVVLVTGAGSGMGRAVAIAFAEEEANVVVNDIDYEAVSSVARKIKDMGRKSLAVRCDVSNSREVSKMFDQIVKQFGTLHILINSAGVLGASALLEETFEEEFDRTMDINLKGVFLCSKAAVPLMKKNKYGKIVNVASTSAKRIASGAGGEYAASKAAVVPFNG
jgi:NADP-dependent 3-hydroxy acid dehydrogenase YdfG